MVDSLRLPNPFINIGRFHGGLSLKVRRNISTSRLRLDIFVLLLVFVFMATV